MRACHTQCGGFNMYKVQGTTWYLVQVLYHTVIPGIAGTTEANHHVHDCEGVPGTAYLVPGTSTRSIVGRNKQSITRLNTWSDE